MAAVLKLVQREDFTGDITSLNLLAWAAGFDLKWPAWTPKVTDGSGKPIKEIIPLVARGSTTDALADVINLLDAMIRYMKQHNSPVEKYGVWFQVQLDGEAGARQAFVKDLTYEESSSPYDIIATDGYYYQELSLILTRTPLWEATAVTNYAPTDNINAVGGTLDYTTYGGGPGAVTGDEAARLALVSFNGAVDGGGPLYKLWCGFRTERFGARANFQPYWSLRKSIVFDADTTGGTTNADATAKDGYKTITTFATVATLLRRATIRVIDVTANAVDQRGTFTILLRAKLSAAGTVRVRLADGLKATGIAMTGRTQGRVPITSTAWQFYELGSVAMPSPGRLVVGYGYLTNYALGLDAERVSGSCNLEMDCIVPIPIGEGFVYAEGGVGEVAGGGTLYVQQHVDDTKDSMSAVAGTPRAIGLPNVSDGLPVGNGILVLAGQQASISVLADYITMVIQVYRRWRTVRGVA